MLVTVVVMVYQNLDMLESTIRGIACQNFHDIELIISDDSSEDFVIEDVFRQARNWCCNCNNIQVHVRKNETNLGIVKHFNKVLQNSHGEIIIPSSCGDVLYKEDTISEIVSYFEQTNCLLATAKRLCYYRQNGHTEIMPTEEQCKVMLSGGKQLVDVLLRGNFIAGACTYYTRQLFEKYGYFNEEMFLIEDYPMYLKLLFLGVKIGFMNFITIKYETNGVSSSEKKSILFMKDMDMIYQTVIVPNKDMIDRKTYRLLECRHVKDTKRGIVRLIGILRYPDVILRKLCEFLCMVTSKND